MAQLSRGLIEILAKSLLGRGLTCLGDMDKLALSYDALIHKLSKDLEAFIHHVVEV